MTVEVSTNKKRVTGNNVTNLVTCTFKAQLASEVRVFKINTGVTPNTSVELTQGSGADFTIELEDDGEGFAVTFAVALALGFDYLIKNDPNLTQPSRLPEESNFPETTVEAALDRNTLLAIKIFEAISRSFRVPETSELADTDLELNPEAGSIIGWNADGDGLTNYTVADIDLAVVSLFVSTLLDDPDAGTFLSSLGFSTFFKTLVDDSDAATLRSSLGLGTAAIKNTGTSGNAVPLLDGANIFSALNGFTAGINVNSSGGSTFNNYTEGTFTPILVGLSTPGTPTYVTQFGIYRRYAAGIFVSARIVLSNLGGMAGQLAMNGLPITVESTSLYALSTGEYANLNAAITTRPISQASGGTSQVRFFKDGAGSSAVLSSSADVTNTMSISFAGFIPI